MIKTPLNNLIYFEVNMKFVIKNGIGTRKVEVDLALDIPLVLQKSISVIEYGDFFKYFSEQHFHICKFRTLNFKDNSVEGSSKELNRFIWLAMAHQAYMERKALLPSKYIADLEASISSMFNLESESREWYRAIHKAIDAYLKSQFPEAIEFLPSNIAPLDEVTKILMQEVQPVITVADEPAKLYS